LIDQIVHRKKLRSQIAEFLRFFAPAAAKGQSCRDHA